MFEIEHDPGEPDHQGYNAGYRSEASEIAGNQLKHADFLHGREAGTHILLDLSLR